MAYKQQKNQVYNTVYDEEIQEYPEITSRLLKLLNNDYDFKKMKEIRDSNIKNVYENYIINKPIIAKAPENAEYMLNFKGCKRTISNIRKEFEAKS